MFKADQCPYTSGNAKAVEEIAKQAGLLFRTVRVESRKQAQNGVHPYETFCILLDGKVLSYRPIGRKELRECLEKAGWPA